MDPVGINKPQWTSNGWCSTPSLKFTPYSSIHSTASKQAERYKIFGSLFLNVEALPWWFVLNTAIALYWWIIDVYHPPQTMPINWNSNEEKRLKLWNSHRINTLPHPWVPIQTKNLLISVVSIRVRCHNLWVASPSGRFPPQIEELTVICFWQQCSAQQNPSGNRMFHDVSCTSLEKSERFQKTGIPSGLAIWNGGDSFRLLRCVDLHLKITWSGWISQSKVSCMKNLVYL